MGERETHAATLPGMHIELKGSGEAMHINHSYLFIKLICHLSHGSGNSEYIVKPLHLDVLKVNDTFE